MICTTWNASTLPGTCTEYCCFDAASVITSTGYSSLPAAAPLDDLGVSVALFEHAATMTATSVAPSVLSVVCVVLSLI